MESKTWFLKKGMCRHTSTHTHMHTHTWKMSKKRPRYHLAVPQIIYTFQTTFALYWWVHNGHSRPRIKRNMWVLLVLTVPSWSWAFKLKRFRESAFVYFTFHLIMLDIVSNKEVREKLGISTSLRIQLSRSHMVKQGHPVKERWQTLGLNRAIRGYIELSPI